MHWARYSAEGTVSSPALLGWLGAEEWRRLLAHKEPSQLSAKEMQEWQAFNSISFLYSDYTFSAWYWEVWDLIEKLFLTSLVVFIEPRTLIQTLSALLFSFASLLVIIHTRPFRNDAINHLAVLARVNIFLFLLTGLMLQVNVSVSPSTNGSAQLSSQQSSTFASVVIGALMTSIVGACLLIFLHTVSREARHRMYALDIGEDTDESSSDEEEAEETVKVDVAPR